MRKISILLASAALAMSGLTSQAAPVTVTTTVYEGDSETPVKYADTTAEVALDEYGWWVLDNLFGTESSLLMSFTPISQGIDSDKALTLLDASTNADYEWPEITLVDANNESITLTDLYLLNGVENSLAQTRVHVYKNSDAVKDAKRYLCHLELEAKANDKDYYLTVEFKFSDLTKVQTWEATFTPRFKVNNAGSWIYSDVFNGTVNLWEDAELEFYEFENFLGSGYSSTYEFDSEDTGLYRFISCDRNTKYDSTSNKYLWCDEEGLLPISLTANGKTYTQRNTRFLQGISNSYILDASDLVALSMIQDDKNYKHQGRFYFKSYVDDPDGSTASTKESTLYVEFNFNDKVEGELVGKEEITLNTYEVEEKSVENGEETVTEFEYTAYGKPETATLYEYKGLEEGDPNVYIIGNFLGVGKSLAFQIEDPELGEKGAFTVLTADNDNNFRQVATYYSLSLTDPNDASKTLSIPGAYYNAEEKYTAKVYKNTEEEAAALNAKYSVNLFIEGYSSSTGYVGPYSVQFNFAKLAEDPIEEVERTPVGSTKTTADFLYYSSGYKDFYAPFEIEVVKNSDGSYTIPNFINSGNDFVFTFEQPEVGKESNVTLLSTNEPVSTAWNWGSTYDDWLLLLSEDGVDTWEISAKNPDGVDTPLYELIYTQDDYSTVTRYDAATNGYDYYVDLGFYAYDESDNATYYYMSFTFSDPKEETEDPVEPEVPEVTELGTETVTIYPSVDLTDDYTFVDYQSMTSELTRYSDNTCIVSDFLGSGKPVTFKYDEPEAGAESTITIQDTKEISGYSGPFLYLKVDGISSKYYTLNLTNDDNEALAYTQAYYYPEYSTVFKYTDAEAAEYGYQYCALFNLAAWNGTRFDIQAWFDFGKVESTGGSSVAELDASNEAPVEYYNLNGIRVANPTNGLYIRKQGADVKKVMIK